MTRMIPAIFLALCLSAHAADPITQSYDATLDASQKARASQQSINKLDDQTRAALDKYRSVLWQAQQQAVYAKQLEQIAATQASEKVSLEKQFGGMDDTEREILPLMLRMLDSLEKFVALDLPFLKSERSERLAGLKRLMADAGAGIAEKYRRVVEAYQIEIEYGRTLGAERAELAVGGTAKIVDVLRVGRTALYFLSTDGEDAGRWDPPTKTWKILDSEHRREVRKGLKMARELTSADVLVLPVAGVSK